MRIIQIILLLALSVHAFADTVEVPYYTTGLRIVKGQTVADEYNALMAPIIAASQSCPNGFDIDRFYVRKIHNDKGQRDMMHLDYTCYEGPPVHISEPEPEVWEH